METGFAQAGNETVAQDGFRMGRHGDGQGWKESVRAGVRFHAEDGHERGEAEADFLSGGCEDGLGC